MSNGGSMADRNNERNNVSSGVASQADSDYAADPASSTFFASDLKKYGDLKNMLESSKDQLRLEAMKRIIGMVAKGKDASELFPSVVKNVVSKNIEIKKLVYAYLIRYAEEQQDLALLSISTFQRALKDPNQLIRANALRVLSSIRVPVIVPIMMLAIRDSTNDMSPYVRKSAALAIPKLYSLDDEQKDQLVEVLEKLLGDRTTLVIGSAVMAFEEVCPERIDLIHKNYRRLCQILMDLEEWGQVAVLNMLTRYARTQFADPNEKEAEEDGDEEFYEEDHSRPKKLTMDSDLRLLLRSAKPLLQSRNSAVVMAVIQLYFHVAPKAEMVSNIKPMIRLLRSHREIQSVVLSNIATLAAKPSRRFLFVPHLKTFFVRSSDPTHIKLQKLEILTSLASATTISIILREFQAYISTSDRELIACTIQAIGRCAMTIAEVTETCLNGLVALLSNRDDNVVGESVCVIRKLLQLQPTAHKDILRHLAKLIGTVTVPMAKASILWLIGEYCEQVPHIAPDVLRQVAKTFPKEENIVKLQVLTLAAKLFTVNPQQTSLLAVYVFNLAKYDINYDIRDRGRFLRALILPGGHTGEGDGGSGGEFDLFSKAAREILLATKPAPVMESRFKERTELQLGTLSHYLNTRTAGYQDLPAFPAVSLPSNVRDVELPAVDIAKKITPGKTRPSQPKAEAKFYSDGETEEDEEEEEEEEDDSSEEDSDEESDDDDEESDEEEEESVKKSAAVGNGEVKASGAVKTPKAVENGSDDTSDESESDDEDDSDEEDSSEEDVEEKGKKPAVKPQVVKPPVKAAVPVVRDIGSPKTDSAGSSPRTAAASSKTAPAPQPSKTALAKEVAPPKPDKVKGKSQNIDMLLDFDSEIASSTASIMPTTAPLFPLGSPIHSANKLPGGGGAPTAMPPVRVPNRSFPLLAGGLNGGFAIAYKFPRRPFIYSAKMVAIELTFTNSTDASLENIKIVRKKLPPRVEVQDFHEIAVLEANRTAHGTVGVDCGDTTQSIGLTVECSGKQYDVTFKPRLCEMLRPIAWNKEEFEKARKNLSGLNENYSNVELPVKLQVKSAVVDVILDAANVAPVANGDDVDDSGFVVRFIGQTVSSSSNVLISVAVRAAGKAIVTVNCEKVMVGSVVLQELREAFSKA